MGKRVDADLRSQVPGQGGREAADGSPRAGGHPSRELGLLIVLLEFCAAQRESQDGVTAEVTRGEIADQAG